MLVFGQSWTSRGIFMKQNIKQANASYLNSNHGQRQESVLFSEILEHIPPADQLSEFFPVPADPYKSDIKPFGLEVLKLPLEGLTLKQISDQLGVSYGRVRYWSQKVKNCLINGHISQRVTVDIPALRDYSACKSPHLPSTLNFRNFCGICRQMKNFPCWTGVMESWPEPGNDRPLLRIRIYTFSNSGRRGGHISPLDRN